MLRTVLDEVGWTKKFAIPEASEENKALQAEIHKRNKEKINLNNNVQTHKDVINALTEHLKLVKGEISHSEALCKTKESETESQRHLHALSQREMGHLKQEISRLESEQKTLDERNNTLERNIASATQMLTEIKDRLKWDQEMLEAWLEETAAKDEDTMAIMKYAKQDESRVRDLTLSIEKMTVGAKQMRKTLDNEHTENTVAKVALEKTMDCFQQAYAEKRELFQQWEKTIKQVKNRDQDIQKCALLLTETHQVAREKTDAIKEQEDFLLREKENNKEMERKMPAAERNVVRLREQLQCEENKIQDLNAELEMLKQTLHSESSDVKITRSKLSSLKKIIQQYDAKVKQAKLRNGTINKKLQNVKEAVLDEKERAVTIEQLLNEQERIIKDVEAQLFHKRNGFVKKNLELKELQFKEKTITSEISGSNNIIADLNGRLKKANEPFEKQQFLLFSQDFEIHMLERKLSRLLGNAKSEEQELMKKKVSALNEVLEEKKNVNANLKTHLKNDETHIFCVTKDTAKIEEEKNNLTSKIQEEQLLIEGCEKDRKKLVQKQEDCRVEKALLKLEAHQLRGLLYDRRDGIVTLEARRLQLEHATKERAKEIRVYCETLNKQLRRTEQEREKLSFTLQEKLPKIETMKSKFEILTFSLAPPEGEEERSQAYYLIQAALEKEELRRRGDELDTKIYKTNKETEALENTLQVLKKRRTIYCASKKDPGSEENLKLEEEIQTAKEKYKEKKKSIQELQEEINEIGRSFEELLQDEAMKTMAIEMNEAESFTFQKDIFTQEEKLQRAEKQCEKYRAEIRSAGNNCEKELDLQELKDSDENINKFLLEAMHISPELFPLMQPYFIQANIELPSPVLTASSRLGSKTNPALTSSRFSGFSSAPSRGQSYGVMPVKMMDLEFGASAQSSSRSRRSSSGKST